MIHESILRGGGVFVTGTGTGVGKTWVSALLTKALEAQGMATAYLKPVETGAENEKTDTSFVAQSRGLKPDLVRCTYQFEQAVAPAVAARMENNPIFPDRILEDFVSLKSKAEIVIVEGAGGLLVPLTEDLSMAGLAKFLGIPLLVVAPAKLGMLNQSALTTLAARAEGLDVLGIVVNRFPPSPSLAERTNPGEVEKVASAKLLGVAPEVSHSAAHHLPEGLDPGACLSPRLGGQFDRFQFLRMHGIEAPVSC